jgi:hypothetical protein
MDKLNMKNSFKGLEENSLPLLTERTVKLRTKKNGDYLLKTPWAS